MQSTTCEWVPALGLVPSFCDSCVCGWRGLSGAPVDDVLLCKWSPFTRLETRTKESNVCASVVVNETTARIERDLPLIHAVSVWLARGAVPNQPEKDMS